MAALGFAGRPRMVQPSSSAAMVAPRRQRDQCRRECHAVDTTATDYCTAGELLWWPK